MDAKTLQEDSESLDFSPSLTKSEMEKQVRRRGAAHKMTGKNELG